MGNIITTGGHPTLSDAEFIRARKETIVGLWRASEKYSLFGKPGKLPRWIYEEVFVRELGTGRQYDYYTPFKKGKEWLFELTCLHQPRTGKLLSEGSDLFLIAYKFQNKIMFQMGLEVQGKTLLIPRGLWGSNVSDWDEHGGIDPSRISTFDFYHSLPRPLADAYWNRFDGINLPPKPVTGVSHWMLPRAMGINWEILPHFLTDRYRGYAKKLLPWFDERFPHLKPKRKGDPYYDFRCMLETLPSDQTRSYKEVSTSGIDSLWVEIGAKVPLVYLVTNGEIDKMRVLTDPVEAVDRYCEHVLLNRIEPFDFYQFSRPLD